MREKERRYVTRLSEARAMKMLKARGLWHSYPVLAAYQSNIRTREHLILKCMKEWENTLQELVRRLKNTRRLDLELLRRLHIEQLELLAHICMFVEDLSYIAYLLNHRPRSLDRSVYFNGTMRAETLKDLASLGTRSIRARFRFPAITKLRLRDRDAAAVAEVFRKCIAGLRKDLQTIHKFAGHGHFNVYNEYKHTFDIFLGLGSLTDRTVHTHIFVRVAPRPRQHKPEKTLILDASPDAVRYYDTVFKATANVINVLVQNSLNWMIYSDGRYLVKIPADYSVPEDLLTTYGSLVKSYGLGWAKTHSLQLSIGFPPSAVPAIQRMLSDGAVAEYSGSLFSRRTSSKLSLEVH